MASHEENGHEGRRRIDWPRVRKLARVAAARTAWVAAIVSIANDTISLAARLL
ncbi:hypothetical protein H8N01_24940 [Streptomyces sp. AC536]|uniref:hypothetical protein n=1 Tax=Streptomyces buecherae TaxID=2763006 RepID=UPI00164D1A38|nr:hypothetical protein [Streptomyces buecherae]MBC3985735.1 hypothetical protein [Streptomyces buecherae]QNJ43992.1 hypothetical protein H7H31_33300 [Streptomyces buecherae]